MKLLFFVLVFRVYGACVVPPSTVAPVDIEEEINENQTIIDNFIIFSHVDNITAISSGNKDEFMAILHIFKNLIQAFGYDIIRRNPKLPENTSYSIAEPDDVNSIPCPDEYYNCLTESYYPTCDNVSTQYDTTWGTRMNLIFYIPLCLFEDEQLLNASLNVYKNDSFPIGDLEDIVIELNMYEEDLHILCDSKTMVNNFTGWMTFDVLNCTLNNVSDPQRYFLVAKEPNTPIVWSHPELIIPMDCSPSTRDIIPIAQGVITEEPEMKYPSLSIHKGTQNKYEDFYQDRNNTAQRINPC